MHLNVALLGLLMERASEHRIKVKLHTQSIAIYQIYQCESHYRIHLAIKSVMS